ncbi:MAG TPA: heliorhodopsin HeR [Candidatus Dojkabacteria bacterium]|nr:heliorhodopsin HeR [Candidatus Dojkabacteria bacterium]
MAKKISFQFLKNFNLIMAVLHFAQGLAMLYLSRDVKFPISVSYLTFDVVTKSLVPATPHVIFNVPLALLMVAFLFMSSLAHLIISTVYNKQYNSDLEKGMNKARWIEYSLSASTMMVGIAILVGIYDLSSLLMIFVLVAIMNLMGLVMEIMNQLTKKTEWLTYNIGVLAGGIPWIVVGLYFWAASNYGSGKIPDFVFWIYVSIFLFFNCFAINMYLQYKKIGPWKDYTYGEKVYIILSLVAKSALAWQVFAGTLRP